MSGSVPYTWIYPRRVTRLGCKFPGIGDQGQGMAREFSEPGMELLLPAWR